MSKSFKEGEETILVTGGTGVLGRNLELYISTLEKTFQRWIFAGQKDADLKSAEETYKLFQRYQPTFVVHLAANVGGYNSRQNDKMLEDNLLINLNVLKAAKTFAVRKVVSMLSSDVFSESCPLPFEEKNLHCGMPHPSLFGYAISKRMIDIMGKIYANDCTKYVAIIPCNIFGIYDNFSLKTGRFVAALIHKFYLAKLNDDCSISIMGTGMAKRQLIYAKDLAKLLVWALYNYDDPEPIIASVSEHEEISISTVANKIAKLVKYDGEIIFDRRPSDIVQHKVLTNKKLMNAYKKFKFTSFDDALEETINWFIENYETIRK